MLEPKRISRILLIVMLFVLSIRMPLLGADQVVKLSEPDPLQAPDAEQLEAKIAELSAISDSAGTVSRELEFYQSALTRLKASMRDDEAASRLKQSIDEAVDRKAELDAALKEAVSASGKPPGIPDGLNLAQLEQRLDQAQAEKNIAENKLAELQARLTNERQRPDQITEGLANIKLQLQETEKKLKTRKVPDGSVTQGEAEWIALMISQQAMRSRLNRLEMERLSSGPRTEHLKTQIEIRREELKKAEAHILAMQEALTGLRSEEAKQAQELTEQVELEAKGKHPLIQEAAKQNARLSAQLGALADRLERAVSENDQISIELKRVTRSLDNAKQQLDVIRLDQTIGALLRSQRQGLPDVNRLEKMSVRAQEAMADARLEQFRVEGERRALLDRLESKEGLLAPKPGVMDEQARGGLKQELEVLFRDRLSLLERLRATHVRYDKILSDLEAARTRLIVRVMEYAELLDRNLIWIPSSKLLDLEVASEVIPELLTVLYAENWNQLFEIELSLVKKRPVTILFLALGITLLLLLRPRMRRALEFMASDIGDVTMDRFYLTFKALIITILMAIPWVLLLAVVGRMWQSEPHPIGDILSPMLLSAAVLVSMIQFSRYLFTPFGLAEVHFGWNRAANALFRRHLRWFMVFTVVMVSMLGTIAIEGTLDFRDSLGRFVFMIWFLGLWLLAHLFLNPWSGAEVERRKGRKLGLSWRSFIYLAVMGLMLFLTVLQFEGYVYTVNRLLHMIGLSIYSGLMVLTLYHLVRRSMLVAGRRLQLVRALEKRQAIQEAKAAREAADAAGESVLDPPEMGEMDITEIGEQTRRLLAMVVTLIMAITLVPIWSELTPAITHLDDILLWEHVVGSGANVQRIPVSVWDVGTNILVIVLMVVAGRNLPGLLEISVLRPLDLDPGSRYTISKISSYLIYGIGTWLALSVLGLRWGDIQWLVAAMGVGLGFGLQEVFANFISGLIILFERPIRIGDTITIGDVSGTVSRIRIRATTVTDWDNKELIVPNKSFVTDSLINWTLSEDTTRIKIPVGIAYGSDTELAHGIMMEVVRAHPEVLVDPPPTAFFIGFGESSLDFEIRVFVKERIRRMPLAHDLHMALDKELRKAGIEIPFPQRDLHVRSVDQEIKGLGPRAEGRGRRDPDGD